MALHQTFVIPSPHLLRERDLLFSSAPNCAASGLSLPCHPDRSNGAFCRCGAEGSRRSPRVLTPSSLFAFRIPPPDRRSLIADRPEPTRQDFPAPPF